MAEFIVLYYAPESIAQKCHNMSPDETKKDMEVWNRWSKSCGEHLVDFGTPVDGGKHIDMSGNIPSKSNVVGYCILKADNIEKAVELVNENPHLTSGNGYYLEVHEKIACCN